MILILLVTIPLAATVLSLVLPGKANQFVAVLAGLATFGLAIALVPSVTQHTVTSARYLRADALSVVFLLGTTFLYAIIAVYTIGYLADEAAEARKLGGLEGVRFARYSRLFFIGLNAFAWSMICAPLVNGLALLWVAVEVTTVVSALLVAIDDTDNSTEAAWKYVLIASCGLGIALLATILMYYAGAEVLGQSYDLAIDSLQRVADQLPQTPVRLAFLLAVVGFGTKVGLFPVHTWLPDAHAEAPTPISALLSGSLLAVSFYAILRFYQIAIGALGPAFPQHTLLVFGVLSLALAALYLFEQRNLKRMLAYSSIEHMGILAIGVSFGAPIALAGVMLHVLAHAAAKGGAFMGAGVLVRAFGSKEIGRIHAAMDRLPLTAPLFLLLVFALGAMPPFGIFRSEFQIVAGGIASQHGAAAAIMAILVTVAFFGLTASITSMVLEPADAVSTSDATSTVTGPGVRDEPSIWMVIPMIVAVIALAVLGIHPPQDLVALFAEGANELLGVRS